MSVEFSSGNDFLNSLSEVEYLIGVAEKNQVSQDEYQLYNKLTILLLTAKLEAFFESIVEEYIDLLKSNRIISGRLPRCMKEEHIFHAIDNIQKAFKHEKIENIKTELDTMIGLLEPNKEVERLNIEAKFNYGKHGQKEVVKLFKKLNINDIFSHVIITEVKEGLIEDEVINIDVKGTINKLTELRNKIMHEDFAPEITHVQNRQEMEKLKEFTKKLEIYLIEHIKETCAL